MSEFYSLLRVDILENAMTIIDDDLEPKSIIPILWEGRPLQIEIPKTAKFYVNAEKPVHPDFLINGLSWLIFSDRLTKELLETCANDIEVFEINLVDKKTNKPVPGYKLINLTKLVACVDMEKSNLMHSKDGSAPAVIDTVIDGSKVPKEINIFRPAEWRFDVILRKNVVESLIGCGVEGIAIMDASNAPKKSKKPRDEERKIH